MMKSTAKCLAAVSCLLLVVFYPFVVPPAHEADSVATGAFLAPDVKARFEREDGQDALREIGFIHPYHVPIAGWSFEPGSSSGSPTECAFEGQIIADGQPATLKFHLTVHRCGLCVQNIPRDPLVENDHLRISVPWLFRNASGHAVTMGDRIDDDFVSGGMLTIDLFNSDRNQRYAILFRQLGQPLCAAQGGAGIMPGIPAEGVTSQGAFLPRDFVDALTQFLRANGKPIPTFAPRANLSFQDLFADSSGMPLLRSDLAESNKNDVLDSVAEMLAWRQLFHDFYNSQGSSDSGKRICLRLLEETLSNESFFQMRHLVRSTHGFE